MRTLLVLALVGGLAAGGTYLVSAGPTCDTPLPYRLGHIDPRFGMSETELLEAIQFAETAWENAAGRNLLGYDPSASLTVNLVFDERQERTIEAQKLDQELRSFEEKQQDIVREYGTVSALYDQRLSAYEQKVAEYQERVREYNREVERWNARGGAPEEEYEALEKEREDLADLANEIERDRQSLNAYAERTGRLAAADQALVERYNREVETFAERYGTSGQFDQGIYDGRSITIYQFRGTADLRLVLIHELGHALGIDHVDVPEAVMYPLLEKQNIALPEPLPADLAALALVCADKERWVRRGVEGFLSKVRGLPILNPEVSGANIRNFTKTA